MKVVFFPEIDLVKISYHSPTRIVEIVSEYMLLFSKNKRAKKTRLQKKQ